MGYEVVSSDRSMYLGTLQKDWNELFKIKVKPAESEATTNTTPNHERYGNKVDSTKAPEINFTTDVSKADLPIKTKSIQSENLETQQEQREMKGATQLGTNMWAFHQIKNKEEKLPKMQIAS